MGFTAPAVRAPGCAAPELVLAPDAVPFHVEVNLLSWLEGGALHSEARCWIWNEAAGTPVDGARLSITPQEDSAIAFVPSGAPGEYVATGLLTPGEPPLATADPGLRYRVSVDADADGSEDAAALVDGPPNCFVIDPPANALRPPAFRVYWRGQFRPDTAWYTVVLRDARTGIELSRPPVRALRYTEFTGVPGGAWGARIRGARSGGPGSVANLSGPRVYGHLWSEFRSASVPLNVVSGANP